MQQSELPVRRLPMRRQLSVRQRLRRKRFRTLRLRQRQIKRLPAFTSKAPSNGAFIIYQTSGRKTPAVRFSLFRRSATADRPAVFAVLPPPAAAPPLCEPFRPLLSELFFHMSLPAHEFWTKTTFLAFQKFHRNHFFGTYPSFNVSLHHLNIGNPL